MPNWCLNEGHVRLPADALPDAKEVFKKLSEGGDRWFANVFPAPPELNDWYTWNLENWGTKWDVTANTDFSTKDNESFYFAFDSAWGPPEAFFENLSDQYGLEYELKYFESGVGFAGKVSYLNGKHSQTHVEGIDYYLFVINEFDEPIETAIYAVEDYSSYEEFIEAEPKFADNSELVSLIKQYYGYKNPPPAPVKKKASKKTAAKKKAAKAGLNSP
jgi:hypothetical protein